MGDIFFHNQEVEFTLSDKRNISFWLQKVVSDYNKSIEQLNFIFCADEYLLSINQQYLNHDFYTDVITFENSENPHIIESDVFISIDRVKENANELTLSFKDELHRVMVHGVLHLVGLKDSTPKQKEEMRKIEDHYLALREF